MKKGTFYLVASLAAFVACVFAVRFLDSARYKAQAEEITCPATDVLLMDTRRQFVCVPGTKPQLKD